MSLAPVPSEQGGSTCAHCGAALVSDQRYCLSCGHPCSPVRLAFLDVLQTEQARAVAPQAQWHSLDTIEIGPGGYATAGQPAGVGGWLRRNSGVLSLLSVLVLCLIAGLLIGHWASQGRASTGPQVIKVEGLSAAPTAATSTPSSSTPAASSTSGASKSTSKEEAEEAKEAAKETKQEKAPPPAPVKVAPAKIQKITKSTGKKHQEEINSLGAQPIETG